MPPLGNPQRRHWAQINESGFAAGLRLVFWIARVLGRWPLRVVLYPVVLWYVLTKPVARRASREYLARIAACATSDPGPLGVLRHFASFAENILDKLFLWSGLFDAGNTSFVGQALIEQSIVAGRGGLFICSHLGNLDLCRVMSRRRSGLKLTVLVHTRHAETFNRLLAELDPASSLNLIQVTDMTPATAILLAQRIEQGEFVVIAGDRVPVSPQPRVVHAPFLGAPAPFPVGPYVLASLLQCPTYLLFSLRAGARSEIHIELFRESIRLPRKGREELLAELATDYAARLEAYCLRAPLQWFNFYDFWHDTAMDTTDASS